MDGNQREPERVMEKKKAEGNTERSKVPFT